MAWLSRGTGEKENKIILIVQDVPICISGEEKPVSCALYPLKIYVKDQGSHKAKLSLVSQFLFRKCIVSPESEIEPYTMGVS